MAAHNPARTLQDEASCSICLDYFKDPVTVDCGHNFCRACITQCWSRSDTNISCPHCRQAFPQRNLRTNRQLGNVVEIAKQLNKQKEEDADVGRVCEKHQEPLKLFCEDDQRPICVVCDKSKTHRAHTVVPIEDAAREYKDQIRSRLERWKQEITEIEELKMVGEMTSQELLEETENERKKVLSEFESLHQFLEERELFFLAQLEVLDKETVKKQNEYTTGLTQEITHLKNLISEMEGKCQQPASEFLQDIRNTLSRCEMGKFQSPAAPFLDLERRIKGFSEKHTLMENALSSFKETLSSEPKMGKVTPTSGKQLGKVNVTLDPVTAHPQLVLCEDRKSVRWDYARQDMPDNPRRFDPVPCVMGSEGFTSGRHYWEVEVGGVGWAVGVARESVRRKGGISLEPQVGIWAVGQLNPVQFVALTSPWTSLPPHQRLRKIRVVLDYEGGQVAFVNAETQTQIFTFTAASFTGRIFPFCWVTDEKAQIRMCY
ncbi:zinc finger protein RFP-like [Alligator sinensis]|uniref:Zinc finger protein RFP-like n=1 Tax=Alligator sinensis TaxID=38654 RepID=A0A1U7RAL6_ALLSI|nr:zinc finger protein RFP-like [Alligator sinensis]